jgi:hypothetical protein
MDNIASCPELDSLADLHEQDARHFRAMFLGLADLGAEMAQVVAQKAKDEAYAPPAAATQLPELVDAYDTLMRSLRRTALLVQKLTAPAPALGHAGQGSDAARKPAVRQGGDSPVDLSKLSDAELDRLDELDRLEGLERLDSEDELAGRPLRDVIAAVLEDFGVATRPGVEGTMPRTTVACAAPVCAETGLVRPEESAEAESMRRNGATGCRDP